MRTKKKKKFPKSVLKKMEHSGEVTFLMQDIFVIQIQNYPKAPKII
jgi:hypothetical protein